MLRVRIPTRRVKLQKQFFWIFFEASLRLGAGTQGAFEEFFQKKRPAKNSAIPPLFRAFSTMNRSWRPRLDSNQDRRFRKPLLYPLELRGRAAETGSPPFSLGPAFPRRKADPRRFPEESLWIA